MISDEELLKAYESAFNWRMVAVDGIALRCHEAGLRAVAAYAAAKQRDLDRSLMRATYMRDIERAPLVTDKPNV